MIGPNWLNHKSSKWGPQLSWPSTNILGDDKETEKHTLLCLCVFLADFEASHALFPTPEKFPQQGSSCWGSDWQRLSLECPSVCILFPPRGILLSLADALGKCSLDDLHRHSQMQNASASSVLYCLTSQPFQHLMSSRRTIQRIVCGHQKDQTRLFRTFRNTQFFSYWWLNSCENYFGPYLPNNT